MSQLDDLIARIQGLPAKELAALEADAMQETAGMIWIPNPGPQTDAYFCEADELFYGGKPGGGKTDLGVGLSLTSHKRTLFLRRQREEAKEIGDRLFEALGTRDGWNGQDLKLRTKDGRTIDVGGCNLETDKQKYKGIPHDLKFFDEISDFTESQFRFITIWTRSSTPGQRCRVVATGNPPTTTEGLWVIKYWAPWLDPTHPNPAKPGELRWYLGSEDGDKEVDGPGPHPVEMGGKVRMIRAKSRTFIPSELDDNPFLKDTNYISTLAGLTGQAREAYFHGKFDTAMQANPAQVIPTAWVMQAKSRWSPRKPDGVPMCAIGADPTGGGDDECVLAPRYDGWYAELIAKKGKELPLGSDVAGFILAHRKNEADVILDMGGGYGGGPYERLKENGVLVIPYQGYHATKKRTDGGKLAFANVRSAAYWTFREALDPDQEGGSPIALPDDPQLMSDLTAVEFRVTSRGLQVTPKEDLVKKLGRSTGRGDAVVMAWYGGTKGITHHGRLSAEQGGSNRRGGEIAVNMGRAAQHGARSSGMVVNYGRPR